MRLTEVIFSLFARDAFILLIGFLTNVLCARWLGPNLMGIWVALLLIPSYSEALGRLQFDNASVYLIANKGKSVAKCEQLLHIVTIISSLFLGFFILLNWELIGKSILGDIHSDSFSLIFLACLIYPARAVVINFSYLFIAQSKIRECNLIAIIQSVSIFFILLILYQFDWLDPKGLLICHFIGSLFAGIYGFSKSSLRNFSLPKAIDLKLLCEMFAYAKYQYLNTIILYFQNNVSLLFAATHLSASQVAIFGIAKSLGEVLIRMIPAAVNTALFPHISSEGKSNEAAAQLTLKYFRGISLILLGIGISSSAVIAKIVSLIYGAEYSAVAEIFPVLLIGIVCSQAGNIFSSYFLGIGRPALVSIAAFFPLLIQLAFGAYLFNTSGMMGGALGFSCSGVILMFLYCYLFARVSETSLVQMIPTTRDVKLIYQSVGVRLQLFANRIKGRNS